MEHRREQLFVEVNGACLVFNLESCPRNGPLVTLGKMTINRASFHKLEMRTRQVQCSLAGFAGSGPTSRGAEREDPALGGSAAAGPRVCPSVESLLPLPSEGPLDLKCFMRWQTILKTCESRCYYLIIKHLKGFKLSSTC